jgi:pimeloyl-ACP methyl ester carboxylesterase
VTALSETYYVIIPDLRGHGRSDKPKAGYHVARLAHDLHALITYLDLEYRFEHSEDRKGGYSAIGTSLGAAILW